MEEAPPPSHRFGNWISRSKTKTSGTAEFSSAAADVANNLKNRSSSSGHRSKAAAGGMRAFSTEAKMLEDMLEAETESPTDDSASTVGERQSKMSSQPSSSSSKRTEKMNTTASASAIVYTAPPPGKNKMSIAPQTPKCSKSLNNSKPQFDLLDLPNWEHPSPAPPIKSPVQISRSGSRRKLSSEKKAKKIRPGKEGNELEANATDHSEAASSIAGDDGDDASYISTGTTQSTQSISMRIRSLRSIGSCGGSKKSISSTKSSRVNRDADDMSQGSSRSGSSRRGRRDGHGSQPMFELDSDSEGDISMDEFFSGCGVQEPSASTPKVYSEITLQITNLSASASLLVPIDLEFDPMDDPTTMSPKNNRDKRSKKPSRNDNEARPDNKSSTKDARGSTSRRSRQSSFKAPSTLDSSADTLDSSISEQCQRKGTLQARIHRPRRGSKKNDDLTHGLPNQSLDFSTSLSSLELLSIDTDDDQRNTSDDGGCSMDGVDITNMTDGQLAELEEKMLRTAMEKSMTGIQLDVSAADPKPLRGGKRPNRRAPPSLTSQTRPPSNMLSSFNSSCCSLDLRDIAGGDEDPSLGAVEDDIIMVTSLATMSPEELAKLEEKMLKMAMQQSMNGISIDTSGGGGGSGGGGVGANPIQISATEAYDRKMTAFNQSSRSTRMPPSATPISSARRLPLTTPLPAPSSSRTSSEMHSPRVKAELISPVNNRPRQHTNSSPSRYNTAAPTSQQSPRRSNRSTTRGTGPSYSDIHNCSGSYPRSSERSSGGSRMAVPPAPLLYGSDRGNNAHISSGSSVCSYGSIDSSATDPHTATRLAEIEQEDVLVELAIQESLRESSGRSQRSSVPYDSFSISKCSVVPGQGSAPPSSISCNNNQYLGRSMFPSSSASDDESEDDELELADAPMPTILMSNEPPSSISCNNNQYLGRSMFPSSSASDDESEDDELELADAPMPTIPMSNQNPSPRCRAQSADCFDISRIQAKARRPARLDSYVKRRPSDKAMI